MTDNKAVLAWANELCQQALTEARGGDTMLANRIGSNGGLKLFFDNVHGTRQVADTSFAAFYPTQWKEIVRLYEEYQRDEIQHESVGKITALESKIDKLEAMITQFIESQQAAPAAEPEKPAKGKKAPDTKPEPVVKEVVETVEETVETEGEEADAESES